MTLHEKDQPIAYNGDTCHNTCHTPDAAFRQGRKGRIPCEHVDAVKDAADPCDVNGAVCCLRTFKETALEETIVIQLGKGLFGRVERLVPPEELDARCTEDEREGCDLKEGDGKATGKAADG
ncbi:hypothetical protein GJ744_012183 [Endocarpon pusillum]|uniref:Uncharacterized protein n=1 Tax=Endocarpon pusillum TaxID=364733 RepID=A0A8H7E2Y6_9EURO|nr:hypothetical protein GJ744_012183 [Endocarpon pusillum]